MILVVTNDKRMQYIADWLSDFFAVKSFNEKATDFNFSTVKYAILPFKINPGIMHDLVKQLPASCTIFTPIMRDFLVDVAQNVEILMDYDEIAIYNSIPTAEGTLLAIMKNTEITVHSANIHVIGAGRCGETLARMLHSIGANVTVATRNPVLASRLFTAGITVADTSVDTLSSADVIVNTVPALMLGRDQLAFVKQDIYIADIASAPGGVDFEAANTFGIKADLLPALPGIIAPKTAAFYLAQFIKQKITHDGCTT